MENQENKDMFDLGSAPIDEDFDPFAAEDEPEGIADEDLPMQQPEEKGPASEQTVEQSAVDVSANATAAVSALNAPKAKATKTEQDVALGEKPPVFVYAGVTENISDGSMTFEELRIEKSGDFPELDDGKRVSWTVEYGKVTKTVADPKGTSIGKMKADIEASKEFLDSLKKAKDKDPVCKAKPRVTAQSKGTAAEYKGVFATVGEAEAAGKMISIVPSRDGRVYEIRDTEMGKFVTPASGSDMLSEVRAGFIPALPRIPLKLLMQVTAFFRHFVQDGPDYEALVNIYWDRERQEFTADVPEQVVTGVSVDSRINGDFTDERYIHYMDIHSHNTMKAFFSPVDDRDEKATRLYTVVGNLDKCVPEVRTRISNGGKFLEIDPAEVFEFTGGSFPKEWEKQVNIKHRHREELEELCKIVCSHVNKIKETLEKAAAV